MSNKDYYTILGVGRTATPDEIKKAYRRLAHKFHPDKEGGDEERFKEINEAYYVLSDAERRRQYDQFGARAGGQEGAGKGTPDFSVFTEGFEGWFADIMQEFFGGGRRASRGRDLVVDVTLTLEQVLTGVREEVPVTRWVPCERCKGSGGEPGTSLKTCESCSGAGRLHRVEQTFFGAMTRLVRCPDCHGSGEKPELSCTTCKGAGRTKRQDRVVVTLPPGMEDGDTFVVEGGGDAAPSPRNGRAGALYVNVHVAAHPRFRREGEHLALEEEVSFATLVLGGSVTIEGLDEKKLRLRIPPGTPSGKVFRIANEGLPKRTRSLRRSGASRFDRGDLFVTVHARVPQKPSKGLIEKLRELSEEL